MARLYEFQGKEFFNRYGIPVPTGRVVISEEEAKQAFNEIGGPVMIKAQVLSGGRGKAGLIRSAPSAADAMGVTKDLLGRRIGQNLIEKLLIEEKLTIDHEFYLGITADPSKRQIVLLFSPGGGMTVEETALDEGGLYKTYINVLKGISENEIIPFLKEATGWSDGTELEALASIGLRLYKLYRDLDCRLAEINPLVLSPGGFFAADARVDLDDDALFIRHKELGMEAVEEAGGRPPTPLELAAGKIDEDDHRGSVHFVQIDPDGSISRQRGGIPIGFDCVGTGTSLTTLDELSEFGYFPLNFADTSGNPTGSKMYRITKIILSQPGIEGYLFVSCVSSQQLDNTARGIIKALKEFFPETEGRPSIPMALCFRGAWDETAIRLFEQQGISKSPYVKLLGRDSTEREVVEVFDAVYKKWAREVKGRES